MLGGTSLRRARGPQDRRRRAGWQHPGGAGFVGRSGAGRLATCDTLAGRPRPCPATRKKAPQMSDAEHPVGHGPSVPPAGEPTFSTDGAPAPERDYPQNDGLHPQAAPSGPGDVPRGSSTPLEDVSRETPAAFAVRTSERLRGRRGQLRRRLHAVGPGRRAHAAGPARRPDAPGPPTPHGHPGDGGGQPEGRRRQDHLHRQPGRRARPARPAGAGDRPRPPGQRLHRARRRAPPRRAVDVRHARRRRRPGRGDAAVPRPRRPVAVVPATIDLAGAEIELVSVVARESRLRAALDAHPGSAAPTTRGRSGSTTCSSTARRRWAC